MNRTVSVTKYCLSAAAAGACAAAIALWPPEERWLQRLPAATQTTYLDCARVLAEQLEPDLVALCSVLAAHVVPEAAT